MKLYPAEREALHAIKHWIDTHPSEMYSLKKLCMQSGMNCDKLKKGFRILFGSAIYQYHVTVKMTEAKKLLSNSCDPVSQIGYMLGYEHASSFCNEFKKFFGESPARFRYASQQHLYIEV
jgi:AraC-like DNA-binding protein